MRGLFGNIGVRLAIVAVVVIAGVIFRDRISGNAGDLKAGDCFELPNAETETVKDVQHNPCNEAHRAEVFLVTDHPAVAGAAIPTGAQLDNFIESTCYAGLIGYVGTFEAIPENIDVGIFYPSDEAWGKGERKVTCYLATIDGSSLTKSLRASQ